MYTLNYFQLLNEFHVDRAILDEIFDVEGFNYELSLSSLELNELLTKYASFPNLTSSLLALVKKNK